MVLLGDALLGRWGRSLRDPAAPGLADRLSLSSSVTSLSVRFRLEDIAADGLAG